MAAAPPTYDSVAELGEIGDSLESLLRVVHSQQELLHSQVDHLQMIVGMQCKLTGVNPLAQEMAAGALAVTMGKRPREYLNPKAVNYMHSIFSIKDAIGKKETRDISVQCGITATQVREFFANQRAKVRKLVQSSKLKATGSDGSKANVDGSSANLNQLAVASKDVQDDTLDFSTPVTGIPEGVASVCTQTSVHPVNSNSICTQVPGNSEIVATVCAVVPGSSGNLAIIPAVSRSLTPVCVPIPVDSRDTSTVYDAVPLNSMIFTAVGTWVPVNSANFSTMQDGNLAPATTKLNSEDGGASCQLLEEATPNIGSDDKKFLEDIFNLMRKEETFSGQVKLMEWVLQIHNSAVLSWFSVKGGITIITRWLSEAALEEQTTVLLVIFKVLCHLPLNKAQPVQMSAILQTVNRLRFYRNSDVSNRAKTLLSRWSKMLVNCQGHKNSSRNLLKNGRKEIRKQRNGEVFSAETWSSKLDIPEEILALAENNEDSRGTEPKTVVRLLTESGEGSSKKHGLIAAKTKERRKVLLVEHPDIKTGRGAPVAKSAPSSNHSRPMSADDIQKAKMRAAFMQEKYGKNSNGASTSQSGPQKAEDHKGPANGSVARIIPQLPPSRKAEGKRPMQPATRGLDSKPVSFASQRPNLTHRERVMRSMNGPVRWGSPTGYTTVPEWRVVAGENSKEAEIQTQRNRREERAVYNNRQEIPLDPKGPWVIEPDYDDSLTPIIPIEQIPDPDPEPEPQPEPESEPVPPPFSPVNNNNNQPNASHVAPLEFTSFSQSADMVSCSVTAAATAAPLPSSSAALGPDPELLQVLLRNPEVVEALMSGEGRNLTQDQLVALLDIVKEAGKGIPVKNVELPPAEPELTSLPSPTPASEATAMVTEKPPWRPEFPQFAGNVAPTIVPTVAPRTPSLPSIPAAFNNLAPQPPTLQQHQPLPNVQLPTRPAPPPKYTGPETLAPPYNQWTAQPSPLAWQPAGPSPANFARRDPVVNGVFDVNQATNPNYFNNPNSYNANMYPRRNGYVHEESQGRSREVDLGFGRNGFEPRMEFGRSVPFMPEFGLGGPVMPEFNRGGSVRPERSAQWQYGPRDDYRGGGRRN